LTKCEKIRFSTALGKVAARVFRNVKIRQRPNLTAKGSKKSGLAGLDVIFDAIPEPYVPKRTRPQGQKDTCFRVVFEEFDSSKHFLKFQLFAKVILKNQDCLFSFIPQ
jgi:hypothetical protein